jgi:quercetin dioxygenase-like cupin family protein
MQAVLPASDVFSLEQEQQWNPKHHVEKILGTDQQGDFTVACREPGQTSLYHRHPTAAEIHFCFAGGAMRTPEWTVPVTPGAFIVHPPGELHEYESGPVRTLLFRVRYGSAMRPRYYVWRNNPEWRQSAEDAEYYWKNPVVQEKT